MTVEHVEVLVEEPSMEEVLRVLLPRLLGNGISFQVYPFNGKQDLLDKLRVGSSFAAVIPEPATLSLLALGLIILIPMIGWRR